MAAPAVRTFELVNSSEMTEVLLSAETREDTKSDAGLLNLVYGGMKFENTRPKPAFLGELPSVVGLSG